MAGSFVKAIFDFPSTEPGDLTLQINDIIQVIYDVDDNWTCGKLYGHVGNFPKNFVVPVDVPNIDPCQKVFAAIKDFDSQVDGDLSFQRGDVIKGEKQLDPNWWEGSQNGRVGIFPITHVQQLEVVPGDDQIKTPSPDSQPKTESPGVQRRKHQSGVIAKGRANMDLVAQLDDELGFYNGDIIEITQVVDSDFAIGNCHGKSGSFPLAFIDVTEGSVEQVQKEAKRHSKFDWWKEGVSKGMEKTESSSDTHGNEQTVISDHLPVDNYTEPLQSEPNLPTMSANDKVMSETIDNHHGPSISDAYVPPVLMDSHLPISSHKRNGSYNQQNTFSQCDGGITAYGKTLFPFVGENSNELTIFDNEIVTLVRHVDDQWIEGEIDGRRGIFPVSYVEIIVDCPYDYGVTQESSNLQSPSYVETTKKPLKTFKDDTFGCVLYDFRAELSEDLNLHEGETIKLISQVDEEWYEARCDDGRVGMCPVAYVELIPVEPPLVTSNTGIQNGHIVAPKFDDAIITNNNVVKPKNLERISVSPDKPNKPAKPAILGPKPSVKRKPQLKPVSPTDSSTNILARSLSVDSNNRDSPPVRPPRPNSFFNKQMSLSPSLDDIIQKELSVTKKELGTIEEPRPTLNSLAQTIDAAPEKSPSFVKIESSTLSASFNTSLPDTSVSSDTPKSAVPSRPPPIPDTKRMDGPPKRTPPPRPHSHHAPPSLHLEPVGPELGPRIIPQRAAPPRPSGGPVPAPRRKRSGDDLMEFSPEQPEAPAFGGDRTEENMEVIQDLERRIEEAQRDLQNYEESKEAVEAVLMSCTDDTERTDLQENVEFYSANISGLTQEIEQITGVLFDLQPERAKAQEEAKRKQEEERLTQEEIHQKQQALRQQHRETRERVIDEILQTEKDYLHSINLCFETFFHTDAFKCPGVDPEMLLGNMDEVSEISQKILTNLETATSGIDFDEQVIGLCFVDLKEELKRVYAPYCRNHDDVIALLAKYEKDPDIQGCFNQMLDIMRKQMSVFDLGSILIKPVQRILKYPLLLNELVKSTEDDHMDKPYLLEGINAMMDVASTINEFKRRKDLVLKYKNTSDVKFSEKMAKLNMHSTKKKLQRFSQKMVGVQTIDESFIREEKKFKSLESAVRIMVRDISSYVEHVQATCQCQEVLAHDVADYYSEKNLIQDVEQFCKVHSEISSGIYYKCKESVEFKVITPLNRLLTMFQGPIKVIKKRHDKLLDYDNLSSRVKNIRDQEQLRCEKESLQSAKNNYEALNAQLLDELPKLHSLSLELIHECVGHLVQSQRDYYNKALEQMYQMLGLQLVLGHDLTNIIETFNISHTTVVENLSDIFFIPKLFNPRIEEKKATTKARRSSEMRGATNTEHSCASQSDSQRAYIRQQYAPDRLYTVKQSVGGSQDMDLDLAQGVMVGVVKEGDPMGNKEHWFVDTGATKGFIMMHFLSPAKGGATGDLPPPEVLVPQGAVLPLTGELLTPQGAAAAPSENLLDLISLMPEQSPSPFGDQGLHFEQEFDQYFEENQSTSPMQNVSTNSNPENIAVATGERSRTGSEVLEESNPHEFQAVYSFTARSALEVDLIEGETVHVIDFHDQDGNLEWWLVQCQERQGYAPSNYLYKVQ